MCVNYVILSKAAVRTGGLTAVIWVSPLGSESLRRRAPNSLHVVDYFVLLYSNDVLAPFDF